MFFLSQSTHENLVQDGISCVIIGYNFFDIFVLLYLGNEITLSTDALSYCLYASNWMEQTQSCKRSIFIVMERLKQPQELIVGKLYPLNLETFTSVSRRLFFSQHFYAVFCNFLRLSIQHTAFSTFYKTYASIVVDECKMPSSRFTGWKMWSMFSFNDKSQSSTRVLLYNASI